jgi:salicylate hydroxylase
VANAKQKILIAGGGIGGMTAAAALLQRGFDVEIFEQASELTEVGAGIQISPNGNRALDSIGAFETLKQLSCKAERKEVRLWNSGKTWKLFDLGPAGVARYGYPYLTVYRPDLLTVCADAVRRLRPESIHLNSRIAGFEEKNGQVILSLQNGQTVTGDGLIGCDGVNSVVRSLTAADEPSKYPGLMIWRGVIPLNALPTRMRESMAVNWIGPNGHCVHYPLREGEILNLAATIERPVWDEESWSVEGRKSQCHEDYAGWHEDVHTLIEAAPKLLKWAYLTRKPLKRYAYGRAALLGDACHPTLPFLAQGAVMALEDGVVLARCLEKYGDVQTAFQKYEDARLVRDNAMVAGANDMTSRFHNDDYRDPVKADAYIDREWSGAAVEARYEWLFTYNCDTAEI